VLQKCKCDHAQREKNKFKDTGQVVIARLTMSQTVAHTHPPVVLTPDINICNISKQHGQSNAYQPVLVRVMSFAMAASFQFSNIQ
jgi:hypothetical protein